jgi:hypothetical protein
MHFSPGTLKDKSSAHSLLQLQLQLSYFNKAID